MSYEQMILFTYYQMKIEMNKLPTTISKKYKNAFPYLTFLN